FSSRRRHTRFSRDWSSDVCSSDLARAGSTKHSPIAVAVTSDKMAAQGNAGGCREWERIPHSGDRKGRPYGRRGSVHVTEGRPYRSEERRVGKEGRTARRWRQCKRA